jgi:hypothetical protein
MQLEITLFPDEQIVDPVVEELFEPNGRRCPHCRQPLTPFGGRLYCLRVGCTGAAR